MQSKTTPIVPGIAGVGGKIKSLGQLTGLLDRRYAPASLFPAPQANPSANGNRNVAITSETQNKPKPQDAAILTLAAGQLSWSFAEDFGQTAPAVNPTPEGLHGGANPGLYIDSISPTGVIVKSIDNTDNRRVHLTAQATSTGD